MAWGASFLLHNAGFRLLRILNIVCLWGKPHPESNAFWGKRWDAYLFFFPGLSGEGGVLPDTIYHTRSSTQHGPSNVSIYTSLAIHVRTGTHIFTLFLTAIGSNCRYLFFILLFVPGAQHLLRFILLCQVLPVYGTGLGWAGLVAPDLSDKDSDGRQDEKTTVSHWTSVQVGMG